MKGNLALIDVGGSSVKVSIYSKRISDVISVTLEAIPDSEGLHSVKESKKLLEIIINAMNLASNKLEPDATIEDLYISSIRQGFCLIQEGNVQTPLYYNSDTTGFFARSDIKDYGDERIYTETGHWFAPQLTLPKLIHLKREKKSLFTKGSKVAFIHDWLLWELTGELVTEMTLVSAGQLARINAFQVHNELLEHFGLDPELIPELKKFGTEIAGMQKIIKRQLTLTWKECVVHVGGGDSHFLHAGASLNDTNTIVVSAGSSTPISFLKTNLNHTPNSNPWKSTSFKDNYFFHEGNVGYPGKYYGWLDHQKDDRMPVQFEKITIKQIRKAPKIFGACQHWTQQSWEKCPPFSIWNQNSSSTIQELKFGLTLDYCFALRSQIEDILNTKQENLSSSTKVLLVGGGANKLLARLLQTILGQTVEMPHGKRAMVNAILILENNPQEILLDNESVESFSEEIKFELLTRELEHAKLYKSLEGVNELIRGVA